jgi:hypothetical protein
MSLADFIPDKFLELFSDPDFSKAIKGYNLYLIKEDPEYRAEVKTYFDVCLVTSELKPIKRIAELETVTGLNDFADFEDDEDHVPTIPEQISVLTEKIKNITISNSIISHEPKNIIPETKTEARAVFLVQYLENEVKERNGELFLNGSEIKDFITKIIPEKNPDCQIKTGQNIRKLKKDVLEKAAKLFPSNIFINKNKNGRKETRILFRPLQTVTS